MKLKLTLLAVCSVLAFTAVAHAQNPFSSITFPIPELGNCTDMQNCKAYCDVSDNVNACVTYGKSHGLLPATTISPTTSPLEQMLKNGGGPGGCSSVGECKSYCSDTTHSTECFIFAKAHSLLSKGQLAQASKANTLMQLIASGQGPGGCTSADMCKAYCQDSTHRAECIAFATKAGLITEVQAQQLTASSTMQGPGGCTSHESCAAFCNDPVNRDACIQFARGHGFINSDDEEHIKEGLSVSQGLAHAPPQVTQCLENTLGSGVLAQLEQENITPSVDILDSIRSCFRSFKPQDASHGGEDMGKVGLPPQLQDPQVQACIHDAVGSDTLQKLENGIAPTDTSIAQKVHSCIGQMPNREEFGHPTSTELTPMHPRMPYQMPYQQYQNGSTTAPFRLPEPPQSFLERTSSMVANIFSAFLNAVLR